MPIEAIICSCNESNKYRNGIALQKAEFMSEVNNGWDCHELLVEFGQFVSY